MSGKNQDLPPEVAKRIRELKALIAHYINPNKKSRAAFKDYGQLTPEDMMKYMAELMGLDGRVPDDWLGIAEAHEARLNDLLQSIDDINLQAAVTRYALRMSDAETIIEKHPGAKELIEQIKRERQSFISKMISASEEQDDNSEGEDEESDDSQDGEDSDSDDSDGDSDDDQDGDGESEDSDSDGEDGDDSESSDSSKDSQSDSDSQSQEQSNSSEQSQDPSDQQSQDTSQDDSQNQEQSPKQDANDGDQEDGDGDDAEELDPESYAEDMTDNADGQPQEEGEDEGEDDGDDGDDGEDGDEGDGDAGEDGDDGDSDGSGGEPGDEDGEGDDGDEFSYGFEQPETPPPGTYQITDGEADPIAVSKLSQSLQMLISRDPEEPTQVPRWNYEKLVRLALEPGADITRAKEPTQIPQDVVFLFDNSGSMNEFEQAARRLAQSISSAAGMSQSHVVSVVTSNGEYSQFVNHNDTMKGNPFHPSSRPNDSGGWYVNGEFMGLLPYDPNVGARENHCARWEYFLKKELPRKHGINPKVILYFSDDHGSIQWCYMSNVLKEMQHIWLDPKLRTFPIGETPKGALKWPRGLFPEGMGGMTNDSLYNKSEGFIEKFCRFKGIYFSNVGGDASNAYAMEDDVCKALKQVAGL